MQEELNRLVISVKEILLLREMFWQVELTESVVRFLKSNLVWKKQPISNWEKWRKKWDILVLLQVSLLLSDLSEQFRGLSRFSTIFLYPKTSVSEIFQQDCTKK